MNSLTAAERKAKLEAKRVLREEEERKALAREEEELKEIAAEELREEKKRVEEEKERLAAELEERDGDKEGLGGRSSKAGEERGEEMEVEGGCSGCRKRKKVCSGSG